jgi:DNA-binding NarL/FixJ family response regulator
MRAPTSSRPRVVVADGQDLTLNGIAHVLTKRSYDVTDARSHDEIRLKLKHPLPDLFIVDYNSVTDLSFDELIGIRQQYESLPIIAITGNRDKKIILKLLESGVHGFMFKDCNEQDLIRCVEALLRGERFFCTEVFDILMEARLSRPGSEQWPSQLTSREVDIIRLIVKGHSTSIIASELNLSPHTISTHRKNIIRKLKIKSPVELVAQAYDLGLITRKAT